MRLLTDRIREPAVLTTAAVCARAELESARLRAGHMPRGPGRVGAKRVFSPNGVGSTPTRSTVRADEGQARRTVVRGDARRLLGERNDSGAAHHLPSAQPPFAGRPGLLGRRAMPASLGAAVPT